jgi:hypothetical protein
VRQPSSSSINSSSSGRGSLARQALRSASPVASSTASRPRSSTDTIDYAVVDADDPALLESNGLGYDAAANAAYWATRPVPVVARVLAIAKEFGWWWLVTQARHKGNDRAAAAALREVRCHLRLVDGCSSKQCQVMQKAGQQLLCGVVGTAQAPYSREHACMRAHASGKTSAMVLPFVVQHCVSVQDCTAAGREWRMLPCCVTTQVSCSTTLLVLDTPRSHPSHPLSPIHPSWRGLLQVLVRLGPAFVKIGQALSSRPDVMPPDYLVELELLQDRIPPFPTAAALVTLQQELGPVGSVSAAAGSVTHCSLPWASYGLCSKKPSITYHACFGVMRPPHCTYGIHRLTSVLLHHHITTKHTPQTGIQPVW